jgi:formylglycine-generating enzyme required for sulfatase activity
MIEMVKVKSGSFVMGWVKERDGAGYFGENAHPVQIAAFELGKYPVTQAQWRAVMGDNPSHFQDGGDTCPVERVSWDMAQQFIQKLNALSGKTYRLPSEAEWEYACRGGENHLYAGSNDIDQVAWYDGNSGDRTHPVGQKQANAWGLHDMSGNVWEWVQDGYHSDYKDAPSDGSAWEGESSNTRVLRGGSWSSRTCNMRAAYRLYGVPSLRDGNGGFRLARTIP